MLAHIIVKFVARLSARGIACSLQAQLPVMIVSLSIREESIKSGAAGQTLAVKIAKMRAGTCLVGLPGVMAFYEGWY
jgi:hypothetical protein